MSGRGFGKPGYRVITFRERARCRIIEFGLQGLVSILQVDDLRKMLISMREETRPHLGVLGEAKMPWMQRRHRSKDVMEAKMP